MATRKETVRICDVCQKSVTDSGELWIGGHPHNGWFSVRQSGGSTDLESLHKQRDWDVCSVKCLKALAEKLK